MTEITRRWDIDALRGLMLVLMTVTHLPTRLSSPMGQPFGFVSAAEGFVLLSAFMAGLVYSRLARNRGVDAMRSALWRRALKVYWCQAVTLIFLFTVIAAVGTRIDQPAVKDLMSFYLAEPWAALVNGLLLIYEPPLLDILPMYILFMLASPWVMAYGLRHGWKGALLVSSSLWILAQFGLSRWIYDAAVALTGLPVPFQETGSFLTFSWQLLWVLGLWMGVDRTDPRAAPLAFPGWVVALAVCIALVGFVWRHVEGQAAFREHEVLDRMFDKWALGPFRLLDFFALIVVTIRFGSALRDKMPRFRAIEALGAASLPVFCAQLVVVLLVLALFGADPKAHAWWVDALLLTACFLVLYGVAQVTLWFDRGPRQMAEPGPAPTSTIASCKQGQGSADAKAAPLSLDFLLTTNVELPLPLGAPMLGAPPADGLQSRPATADTPPH